MLSITTLSCSSNDHNNQEQPDQQVISQIENNLINGSWRIIKFIDSDEDETQHFTGFNFTFGTNGVLTAGNGSNSYE